MAVENFFSAWFDHAQVEVVEVEPRQRAPQVPVYSAPGALDSLLDGVRYFPSIGPRKVVVPFEHGLRRWVYRRDQTHQISAVPVLEQNFQRLGFGQDVGQEVLDCNFLDFVQILDFFWSV